MKQFDSSLNSNIKEIEWNPSSTTSLLEKLNEIRGTHMFPISIIKISGAYITDLPSGSANYEFACIIYGNVTRFTVQLIRYEATVNNVYFRQVYSGSWRSGWTKISTSSV